LRERCSYYAGLHISRRPRGAARPSLTASTPTTATQTTTTQTTTESANGSDYVRAHRVQRVPVGPGRPAHALPRTRRVTDGPTDRRVKPVRFRHRGTPIES